MTDLLSSLPDWLVRTTVFIAISALVMQMVIRLCRVRAAWLHRVAWIFVLLQGVIVLQWSLEIPWYETTTVMSSPASGDMLSIAASAVPLAPAASARVASVQAEWSVDNVGQITTLTAQASTLLRWIWVVGMVCVLAIGVTSYSLLLYVIGRATYAPRAWQGEWNRLTRQAGIRREIPLLVSDHVGPVLCLRPNGYCVVVPETQWEEFSSAQRVGILRHELAHLQRGDVWKSLLARMIALVHWFNPCAWLAVRRFDETAEWACDQTLADSDPRSVPDYARALIHLISPQSSGVGASAARGASISIRLQRLLSLHNAGDSLMKRAVFSMLLASLATAGLLRFHLVAQERDVDAKESAVTEQRVHEFAKAVVGDDELVNAFRQAARTPAGHIVLQDRASFFTAQREEEARNSAVPAYFEEHFSRDGTTVRLRSGQEAFRAELVKSANEVNTDLAKIRPALAGIAEQITPQSDMERLAIRFLNSEASAVVIYAEELRERLHPDERVIEYALADLLVKDEDGTFAIRPASRAKAEEMLKQAQQILAALGEIRRELAEYEKEMATPNELNKQLKAAAGDPFFAAFIAAQLMEEGGNRNTRRKLDNLFEQLDHLFVVTADGIVASDEQSEEVQQVLSQYTRIKKSAGAIRKSIRQVAAAMKPVDDLHKGWSDLLKSDIAVIKIGEKVGGIGDASVEDIVRELLQKVLVKGDDGKLRVDESKSEQLNEVIQSGFRGFRNLRRKARVVDSLADKLDDRELATTLQSLGGKYYIMSSIKRRIQDVEFDGFGAWIADNFDRTDEGWQLKAEAREEIEEIIAQSREIAKELDKDDF